jgi:hypothetical protein
MYKLYKSVSNEEVVSVTRLTDNTSIPLDPNNSDYQEYLKWVAEGNTPEPADE